MLALGLDLPAGAVRRGRAAVFDFSGRAMPPGATLTRASAATRVAATGMIESVAANVARFDHDPATRAYRGLLIEGARGNDFLYSEALPQSYWTKAASGAVADAATAPDGTGGADLLVPTSTTASHSLNRAMTLSGGATYTVSAHLRAAGYSIAQLYGTAGYGSFYLNVDLAAGAETAFGMGTSNVLARTIQRLDGGWYRVAVTLSAIANGTATFQVAQRDDPAAARAAASTGDGTSAIAIWGLQHETGAGATSYIPTGAAAATRAADALVLDWGGRGVADGAITVRYTFDDASTQDVATVVSGGSAAVPTDLRRRWIMRAEKA